MNSLEIIDKKEQLKLEVREMVSKAKAEIRELTADEQERVENIKEEITALIEELRKLSDTTEVPINQENNKNNKTQMEKNFSLLRAIRNVAENKVQDELTQAVIDAGQNEMRKSGVNGVGQIQLPSAEQRTITVATEGADTVATDLMDVLTPLRAKSALSGAKWLTGLTGDVQYPVLNSFSATWEGETAETSATTPTFTNVKLSPKRLSVVVPVSKQFLVQDSIGAENALRTEIINAVRDKLETTVLGEAAGTATQPAGLCYNGGTALTVVEDFADICNMESDVEDNNVYGNMVYIMSPKAKAALRGITKGTNAGAGMILQDGEIDGTPVISTSNVANKDIIYGSLDNLAVASWGMLDVTVDTVTLAAEGCVRLIVNAYFDAKVLRTGAFAVRKTN